MTAVAVYVALVVVIPALGLGHHGQHWPLQGAWRGLWRPNSPSLVSGATEPATEPHGPRTAPRRVPSWAHTEPYTHEEAA